MDEDGVYRLLDGGDTMIYSRNSLYFQVIFLECLTAIMQPRKRCAKEWAWTLDGVMLGTS